MIASRRRVVAAWCLIGVVATSGAARAAPSAADIEEAKRHYARGVLLYNQGADAAALAELERAYELAPNWKVLYNLGLVQLQMNDFAAALRSFERFLDEGGAKAGGPRRAEVLARIEKLRDQVATIDVSVSGAPDADLALDDEPVGQAPLAKPLVVNPGHHKVRASKTGRMPETRVVSVAGGDHAKIDITLEEPPAPPPVVTPSTEAEPLVAAPAAQTPITPSPTPPPPGAEPARPQGRGLWIGWVGAGALASGAVVTGLVALNANAQLTRAKGDGPTSGDDLNRLSARAQRWAVASDVMTGGAVVTAGITLFLTLQHVDPPPPAQTTAGVRVDLGPTSVAVRGAF